MVIREDRDKLHELMTAFRTGELSVDAFVKALDNSKLARSRDRIVAGLMTAMGESVVDDHFPFWGTMPAKWQDLDDQVQQIFDRCCLFLRTNLEYSWPPYRAWRGNTMASCVVAPLWAFTAMLAVAVVLTVFWFGPDFLVGVPGVVVLICVSVLAYRAARKFEAAEKDEYEQIGDYEVWPFLHRQEYEQAAANDLDV